MTEYRDWRTHNRNHMGPWGPVHGVMIHHTVSSGTDASVRLCYEGRSDLPGPLCHTVGAKDGTLYMVGHGRANHAGRGDGDVLAAVIDERPLPPDNAADTDGNPHFYGIELINLGDGEDPWPEAQVDAAARWAAAICRAHKWSAASVIGHKEWQPGKIDPTFDMAGFRARVARLLASDPGTTPAPDEHDQEDETMPTPEQIAKAVWEHRVDDPLKDGNDTVTIRHSPAGLADRAGRIERALGELAARGAAWDAVLDRLAEVGGLDAAEVRTAAEAGARAALDQLADALKEG